jgi:hypothetical protein
MAQDATGRNRPQGHPGPVYATMGMPWAKLEGQIAQAYGK